MQVAPQLFASHGPGVGVGGGVPQVAMQAHGRVISSSPAPTGAGRHWPFTAVPSEHRNGQGPPQFGEVPHEPGSGVGVGGSGQSAKH
jgi:hypothetical protein